MRTLRRRRPVDEPRRTEEAVEAAPQPSAWSTARHLDETVTLQGFWVLHDCRWPGTRNGRIDHVVVGATGVFVVHDAQPEESVAIVDGTLRSGRFTLAPELRRVHDQAQVVRGILGDVEVLPVLSVHDVPLPRHSFLFDGVRVAASLWPTSQVIARPTPCHEPSHVERLAAVAIEALRPEEVAGPRTTPPGGPIVSLPFIPVGSPAPERATWAETDPAESAGARRTRFLRRATTGAVLVLMALGVTIELTGVSSLHGDPAPGPAPAAEVAGR